MEKRAQEVKEQLLNFHFPRWDELPGFDVYMDQVVYYVNEQLSPLYFNEEKIITSSMVNNYVKNSIVVPPEKKHYKKYHLAYLIAVCILKRCFSLTEISKLIEIQSRMKNSNYKEAYNTFADIFEDSLHHMIETNHLNLGIDDHRSPYYLLLSNVIQTVVSKIYTEYAVINDQFYPEEK